MMKINSQNHNLSAIPLRNWPPEAIMEEAKRTARLWTNRKEFSPMNGGLFSDPSERAAEIVVRVLDYLRKKQANDSIDQVTFFHQIARYRQFDIIKTNYCIPSITEGSEDYGGDEADYVHREIADQDAVSGEEVDPELQQKLVSFLRKIGVGERDFTLFDTSTADWVAATGMSEREHRAMKARRKKEIIEKIKSMNLVDELVRLMPVLRMSIFAQI